jgi:TP901 family phage tail tape measure protein
MGRIMTSGFNLGNAYGRIVISDNVDEAINQAQRAFDRGIGGIGSSMQRFGDSLTGIGARITALTAPITAFGIQGVRAASDFQDALNEIQVRAQLTDNELEQVRQKALQLGRDTTFSAGQAAEAFLQLLTSGQSVGEAFQTIDTVMLGASAAGSDLGFTADAVTDILAQFGLQASDSAYIMQTLSNAAGSSSATFEDLVAAFQNSGNVAFQAGMNVEELAATIAALSEKGIKGSNAGTALRSTLNALQRDTEDVVATMDALGVSLFDATGAARPIADVFNDIQNATQFMTDEQRTAVFNNLADTYARQGLGALTAGQGIDEMIAMMANGADIADIAAKRMDSFSGSAENLRGSIETLQINALTPFAEEDLKNANLRMAAVVNRINDWVTENPQLARTIVRVAAAVTALGPALVALGITISTIGIAIGALASPITLVIGAVGALGVAWINNFMGMRDTLQPFVDGVARGLQAVWYVIDFFIQDIQQFGLKEAILGIFGKGSTGETEQSSLEGALAGILGINRETSQKIIERIWNVFGSIRDAVAGFIGQITPLFNELGIFFSRMLGKIDLGKMLQIGQTLLAMTNPIGQISLVLKAMGVNFGDILGSVIDGLTTFFATLNEGGNVFDGMRAVFGDTTLWTTLENGFNSVVSFIQEQVFPALEKLRAWFLETALPAVVGFVQGTVIPAVQQFIDGLANVWALVGPALQNLGNWFIKDVLPQVIPIVDSFINLLGSIWEVVGPALGNLAVWFLQDGLPLIQQFISEVALPAIQLLVDIIAGIWDIVRPILEPLLDWFITSGLPIISDFISNIVIPVIQALIDIISSIWDLVREPLQTWAEAFGTILQGILDFLDRVISTIGDAIEAIKSLDQTGKGRGGLFGSGIGPDFDPLGGIRGWFDEGGYAAPNSIAQVGAGQMGREAFIVGDQGGTFYPDFARNLAQIAAGVMASRQMGVTESGLSQGGGHGGDQIYVSIEVPLDVLRNEPGLQANADTLASGIKESIRRRG